jgi:putative nucleotidyltransferase with HDIG domain
MLKKFLEISPFLYKTFLLIVSVLVIVYFLPSNIQYSLKFVEGKRWMGNTLYAPFDFPIIKSKEELQSEKKLIESKSILYFDLNEDVSKKTIDEYSLNFNKFFKNDKDSLIFKQGLSILKSFLKRGILPLNFDNLEIKQIALISNNIERFTEMDSLFRLENLSFEIDKTLISDSEPKKRIFYNFFFEILQPNLLFIKGLTEEYLNELNSSLSLTRDLVLKGEVIIETNQVIEGEKLNKLRSLNYHFSSKSDNKKINESIQIGYFLLVFSLLILSLIYIYKFRYAFFENDNRMTFIFLNISLSVIMSTVLADINPRLIYVAPICIFPLLTKTFFDSRLAFFIHIVSVIIISFTVFNGFEYIFIQILAGIISILSTSKIYKRANLFISVSQITFMYFLGYIIFYLLRSGNIEKIDLSHFGFFLSNGMLTLFVLPLIYLYEKIFFLVSDVSLLELSDTNSPLLKELSDKAPGTFHHSLQVANLSEACANEINANSLLTRVGALYHDIGKIQKPNFFSENQMGSISPHDELSPEESVKIIISHVTNGITLGKKNKLPDRIIDFIRTHHGTSKVYFFYKKQIELNPNSDFKKFIYPGPKPFSKETSIVMMADAIEAASKSLKEPSFEILDEFVHKIINQQMNEGQFINSNITFSEIEMVKKVLIKKLVNIYQLRIEYPS